MLNIFFAEKTFIFVWSPGQIDIQGNETTKNREMCYNRAGQTKNRTSKSRRSEILLEIDVSGRTATLIVINI